MPTLLLRPHLKKTFLYVLFFVIVIKIILYLIVVELNYSILYCVIYLHNNNN